MSVCVVGESEGRTFPPGYFSPIALDPPDISSEIIGDRRRILSQGARVYLEKQFENLVVTTLDANSSSVSADK